MFIVITVCITITCIRYIKYVGNNLYNYMELLPFFRLEWCPLGHDHSSCGRIKGAWLCPITCPNLAVAGFQNHPSQATQQLVLWSHRRHIRVNTILLSGTGLQVRRKASAK